MNELLAAGVDYDTADKWLPQIMKYATASGALPKELADNCSIPQRYF
ncbi:hypothetical protein [Escherichia coli]